MYKEVFVGGVHGSGTRLAQFLLLSAGYCVGNGISHALDFVPTEKFTLEFMGGGSKVTDEIVTKFKNMIDGATKKDAPFSIKHGDLMFDIPIIRKAYPNAKIIIFVRHGIDNMVSTHHMESLFGHYITPESDDFLKFRMKFWNEAYKLVVKELDDNCRIVKLEDFMYDTKNSVDSLFKWLDIHEKDMEFFYSLVEKKSSVGRHKNPQIIHGHGYVPEIDANKMYTSGKEMMDYFGYKDESGTATDEIKSAAMQWENF